MVLGKTSLCLGKPSVCQSSEGAWLVPMPWHRRQDLPAILDFLVAMSWNLRDTLALILDVRGAVQAPSWHA
jgi:hypothetical protein